MQTSQTLTCTVGAFCCFLIPSSLRQSTDGQTSVQDDLLDIGTSSDHKVSEKVPVDVLMDLST